VRLGNAEAAAGAASILGMVGLPIGVDGSEVVSSSSTQRETQAGMYNTVKLRATCLRDKVTKQQKQITLKLV
jgi:hypothetical protein